MSIEEQLAKLNILFIPGVLVRSKSDLLPNTDRFLVIPEYPVGYPFNQEASCFVFWGTDGVM